MWGEDPVAHAYEKSALSACILVPCEGSTGGEWEERVTKQPQTSCPAPYPEDRGLKKWVPQATCGRKASVHTGQPTDLGEPLGPLRRAVGPLLGVTDTQYHQDARATLHTHTSEVSCLLDVLFLLQEATGNKHPSHFHKEGI